MPRRVIIMGAAGRDFHNFNSAFRGDPATTVVAFTATQIPYIDDRTYPAALAGPAYPEGIPIFPEERLEETGNLIAQRLAEFKVPVSVVGAAPSARPAGLHQFNGWSGAGPAPLREVSTT